jgi:hypothetical protein
MDRDSPVNGADQRPMPVEYGMLAKQHQAAGRGCSDCGGLGHG